MKAEEFNALPKREKAVLVAKDILKYVNKRVYKPITGCYIRYPELKRPIPVGEQQLQKHLSKIKDCHVCAIGSIILSSIRLGNEVTTSDLDLHYSIGLNQIKKSKRVTNLLKSVFDKKTLLIIENCFESVIEEGDRVGKHIFGATLTEEEERKCSSFYAQFNSSTDRLIAICNNIIENGGKFVLPKE